MDNIEIRRAEEKDCGKIMDLLSQVLEVHAGIRPDIFNSGTTKYSRKELLDIMKDSNRPIYVAADEEDRVVGYAFCILTKQPETASMVQFTSMYIDDLCVDNTQQGKGIASNLFNHVKSEAIRLGCREITLNVWEGNDNARHMYEHLGMKPMKTYMEYIL